MIYTVLTCLKYFKWIQSICTWNNSTKFIILTECLDQCRICMKFDVCLNIKTVSNDVSFSFEMDHNIPLSPNSIDLLLSIYNVEFAQQSCRSGQEALLWLWSRTSQSDTSYLLNVVWIWTFGYEFRGGIEYSW